MDKQTYISRIQDWYDEPRWRHLTEAWLSGAAFAEANGDMMEFLWKCQAHLDKMSFEEFHQWLKQGETN